MGILLRRQIPVVLALPASGDMGLRLEQPGMPVSVKCLAGAVNFLRNDRDYCACLVCGTVAGFAAVTCRP